ncbi:hypothetical protein WA026_001808 [Henosepilachna vigintioctopunctata]|uniref:Uncharacterized protein n=1 Tax=Henosepilachna vigintioctopunctata TaxID=420089 RepID=A0AAW1UUW9_9CUCU
MNKRIEIQSVHYMSTAYITLEYFKGNNQVVFKIGDKVLARDYRNPNRPSWIKVTIQKKIGKVTYIVNIRELEKTRKRHANQLKRSLPDISHPNHIILDDKVSTDCSSDKISRPKRNVKPPERYQAT